MGSWCRRQNEAPCTGRGSVSIRHHPTPTRPPNDGIIAGEAGWGDEVGCGRVPIRLIHCPRASGDESGSGPLYIGVMHTFASIMIGLMLLATVGVLFAGMIGMVRGQSGATSNRLMRYRVLFQAATLVLLVLFMSLLRS
jgi:Hypoxia induced protein conserved region